MGYTEASRTIPIKDVSNEMVSESVQTLQNKKIGKKISYLQENFPYNDLCPYLTRLHLSWFFVDVKIFRENRFLLLQEEVKYSSPILNILNEYPNSEIGNHIPQVI